MDELTLRRGIELLNKRDMLIEERNEYLNFPIRLVVRTKYIDIKEEDEQAIRKIFVDKLDAQIKEIERQIAEL